jgi:hypothetical protein
VERVPKMVRDLKWNKIPSGVRGRGFGTLEMDKVRIVHPPEFA